MIRDMVRIMLDIALIVIVVCAIIVASNFFPHLVAFGALTFIVLYLGKVATK